MAEPIHPYPVREDIRFQNAVWILERIGWALLALVPLAAVAGLFSHGPLSDRTAAAPGAAFTMEYERFQRVTVQTRFVFRMQSTDNDAIRLRLSPSFHETYDIQSLHPVPARTRASAEGLDLYFTPAEGELTAVMWATPRSWGRIDLTVENDSGTIRVPVLIYP